MEKSSVIVVFLSGVGGGGVFNRNSVTLPCKLSELGGEHENCLK